MSWGETVYLMNVIEGNKKFVGSVGTILKEGTEITPKLDGSLCFVLDVSYSYGSASVTFDVYEEGVKLTSAIVNLSSGENKQVIIPFNITKGKKYTFIKPASGNVVINSVYVGGQITDYNYFD